MGDIDLRFRATRRLAESDSQSDRLVFRASEGDKEDIDDRASLSRYRFFAFITSDHWEVSGVVSLIAGDVMGEAELRSRGRGPVLGLVGLGRAAADFRPRERRALVLSTRPISSGPLSSALRGDEDELELCAETLPLGECREEKDNAGDPFVGERR